MVKLFAYLWPKPLINRRAALLQSDLGPNMPRDPIIEVNDRYCVVNHNGVALRNLFIIPWLLGIMLTCFWHVDEFITDWNKAERGINRNIAAEIKMHGRDFMNQITDPEIAAKYKLVDRHGVLNFRNYLKRRYGSTEYWSSERITDILLLVFYGISLPLLLYWSIRFPRIAPLVFDRERRLVSTWRSTGVALPWAGLWSKTYPWVQRYDKLRYFENFQTLTFILRGETRYGAVGWSRFAVQPTGNPFYGGSAGYETFLAFIAQFMEYGKDHVLKGQEHYKIDPHFYFFADPQPKDFESQIGVLLQRIDALNDETPLDAQGNPLPVDLKEMKRRKKIEGAQYLQAKKQ